MKKILLILWSLSLFFAGIAQAESVTLAWTDSTSPDVVSYRVYQSLIEGMFAIGPECNAVVILDGTDECMTKTMVDELIIGYRYHFIVTAIDSTGNESEPSNMVSITIDPASANPVSTGVGNMVTIIQ